MSEQVSLVQLRKLDVQVIAKVMGWKRGSVSARDGGPYVGAGGEILRWEDDFGQTSTYFHPSVEIEAAFEVVEKMRARKFDVHLIGETNHFWDCQIYKDGMSRAIAREGAETLPLAICRAALKALESRP